MVLCRVVSGSFVPVNGHFTDGVCPPGETLSLVAVRLLLDIFLVVRAFTSMTCVLDDKVVFLEITLVS